MPRLKATFDPFVHDPGRWGNSLANNAELILPCLDAAGARSVVEIGAYAGDVTRLLLDWASQSGARIVTVDPSPQDALVQLASEREDLELVTATSLEALAQIELPDAVIVDGDHNYYTVTRELETIHERAHDRRLPLILFHDVCWPHARRDDYFDPAQIPEDARQPYVAGAGLFPGDPGVHPGSLPFRFAAAHEGGPRNGVLTAVEQFVSAHDRLRLAVVPAFFGLGVVWDTEAPWSGAVAEILAPWDRNSLLERLEANRVFHLASVHVNMVRAGLAENRNARKNEFLKRLLVSKTFGLAVLLSRLRQGGEPAFSKDEIRQLLDD
jgi:methyltransferase family protein